MYKHNRTMGPIYQFRILGKLLFAAALMPVLLAAPHASPAPKGGEDAYTIVKNSYDYWRGDKSYAEMDMVIHRPEWERKMSMRAWTQGEDKTLVLITSPPKDRGSGTLRLGRQMWNYIPAIRRTIKLPPSMMAQAWMGSDFSNNDLAKADSILVDYTHRIVRTDLRDGHTVFTIESTPKPNAPVVWGKEILEIRDDYIFLSESFYDEEYKLVKVMRTEKIQPMGGRLFPAVWRMKKADRPDEYTLIVYRSLDFSPRLPPGLFTLQRLKNPRM
ncbi:MAG: outer membrane lipoprotein-sorting protein [Deltaproteobacteria bacterium]|nr:outer membrane lipoprotein-sorting protein [Deltaproteobacteria bacterium]